MKLRHFRPLATALAVLALGSSIFAQNPAPGARETSTALREALGKLKPLQDAKNWDGIIALLDSVPNVAPESYDKATILDIKAKIYLAKEQLANAIVPWEEAVRLSDKYNYFEPKDMLDKIYYLAQLYATEAGGTKDPAGDRHDVPHLADIPVFQNCLCLLPGRDLGKQEVHCGRGARTARDCRQAPSWFERSGEGLFTKYRFAFFEGRKSNSLMCVLRTRNDHGFHLRIINKFAPIASRAVEPELLCATPSAVLTRGANHFENGPEPCVEHSAHGGIGNRMRLAHISRTDNADANLLRFHMKSIAID